MATTHALEVFDAQEIAAPVRTAPPQAGTALTHDLSNPAALLHEAVVRGASVEQLKELVGLHERIEERQARKAYFDAMAQFQKLCPSVKKSSAAKFATRTGQEMSYTFAALDEIAKTVNPILTECGLSYTWDSKVEAGVIACVCTVRHVLGHQESASIQLPTDSASAMSSQQKVGAALTFARRLSLTQALGLTSTDDDMDGRDVEVATITDDQADALLFLAEEVKVSQRRLLKWLGVQKLTDLSAKKYAAALQELEKKRGTT